MRQKLLIVANNCPWKSWPDKIEELRQWFSPKVQFEITILHTKYQNVPFVQYGNPSADQAHITSRPGVDPKWYDTFVSPMARDYDYVLFVLNMSQWPASSSFRGWRTDRTFGAIELQIGASETERFQWGDYTGGAFFNFARHEIMHGLFMATGQKDTTHFWWDQSPEKLSNALNELVFAEAKEADEISRLQKIINALLALIGLQKSLNTLIMETKPAPETTTESPKNPTRKDFCLGIQGYEGYYAPGEDPKFPNGTLAWRNKNPGNLRYAKQTGSVGANRGFAVFPDYETGFAALMRQVEVACTGKSKVFTPGMTILEFFKVYAPSGDSNNPDAYASWVAKKIGVSTSFVIKDLVV